MKKKLLILTSLFLLMFTSGCVKQKDEYVITIDKNDNVTLSETVGIDKENLKMMNKEYGSFVGTNPMSYKNLCQNLEYIR